MSSKKKQLFKIIILGDSGYSPSSLAISQGRQNLPHEPIRQRSLHPAIPSHRRRRLHGQGGHDRRENGHSPGTPSPLCLRRFGTPQAKSAFSRWAAPSTEEQIAAFSSTTSPIRNPSTRSTRGAMNSSCKASPKIQNIFPSSFSATSSTRLASARSRRPRRSSGASPTATSSSSK